MNGYHDPFHHLLTLLSSWTSLSPQFRRELNKSLALQHVNAKQELIAIGKHLQQAWYSVDCWVAEFRITEDGREEVSAIHSPNTIFTDINSFLTGDTSHQSFTVINGTQLISIKKQQFNQLRIYPETPLLLERYFLAQHQTDQWRLDLMYLSDRQKFNRFAAKYPVNQLPGKLCASFLRMTPSRYSAAKKFHNLGK